MKYANNRYITKGKTNKNKLLQKMYRVYKILHLYHDILRKVMGHNFVKFTIARIILK